jgi:hypothetical protein
MESSIYFLHRGDNQPFYVGESKNPKNRLHVHTQTYGGDTQMEIVSTTKNWREEEQILIKHYIDLGYNLLNKNKGGGGVAKGTKKPKDFGSNMSKARKGNWTIPQHQIDAGIEARNKPVLQYTKDGVLVMEHKSATLAADYVGSHRVNMYNHIALRKGCKSVKGHIFKYK